MAHNFHIEVNCQQNLHDDERVCGDVFLTKNVQEEGRIIIVLSDGMGHGVKANILGTLTATMAINFTREHKEINKIAEIIMNTLPVDSEKKISFSTFSIIDIESDGKVTILEFENPQCLVARGNQILKGEWKTLQMATKRKAGREIRSFSFYAQKEDRIVLFSDGVSQSGMGSVQYPQGWGTDNAYSYVVQQISKMEDISASKLAYKVIAEAYKNDGFACKDDTSCAVVYFREPRKLIICTGPPYEYEKDKELAKLLHEFNGRKIICGGTTGDIIARELNLAVADGQEQEDPELPPISFMQDIDLYTEGILTLSKVHKILRDYNNSYKLEKGPADQIVRMILESDDILFLVGTRINEAHQDPKVPVELEMRRTLVRRIEKLLEEKLLKNVIVRLI
jgi:hypothetical protein